MATVAYRIVSHYSPPPEDSDSSEETESADLKEQEYTWNAGPSFGERSHRASNPPRFVTASGLSAAGQTVPLGHLSSEGQTKQGSQISGWYRSLRATEAPSSTTEVRAALTPSEPTPKRHATSIITPTYDPRSLPSGSNHPKRKLREPDWFINAALRSQSNARSNAAPTAKPLSSMADILSRAPPPLANEAPFVPPVRTIIGPSNRGYAILQQSGWKEGEGLGSWRKGKWKETQEAYTDVQDDAIPKLEMTQTSSDPGTEGSASGYTKSDIIDLTLSSDDSDGDDDLDKLPLPPQPILRHPTPTSQTSSTILLTPLPTFFKPDRLGIGSKAAGKPKPLRHTVDALRADVRRGDKARRIAEARAREVALRGRGSKGLARKHKKEEQKRRDMMGYMNS